MSHTFTSNPSRVSRGRGAARGGTRGASTTSRPPQIGVGGRSVGTSMSSSTSSRSTSTMQNGQGPRQGQQGLTVGRNYSTNNTRVGARGRGRMDNTRDPGAGACGGSDTDQREDGHARQSDLEGRGQYAGGYTVFSPNEKKRQEISRMAQRETAAYEKYKQENSTQSFSYVGTVGGGLINENQARARQAQQVRAAKFNRQMKQEERRQATKKAEEDAIEAKRADARRKAELNAQREARGVSASEVRRNRAAFLAQFEQTSPGKTSSPSGQDPVEPASSSPIKAAIGRGRGDYSNNNAAASGRTNISPSISANKVSTSLKNEFRNPQGSSPASKRDTAQGRQKLPQTNVKTEPQVAQERAPPDAFGAVHKSHGVHNEVKHEREDEHGMSEQLDEQVAILLSMYPYMEPDELRESLLQMGSLDRVIDAFGSGN